jgi:hypothetical protein
MNEHLQLIFRVVVNQTTEHRVTTSDEADSLCDQLAERSVFVAHVYGEQSYDPSLDIIVESGRATAFYMNMEQGVKLASRDQMCTERDTISLRNDAYPDLVGDLIEVPRRSQISPDRALAILRHYLKSGEPIDLVPWPSPDELEWYGNLTPDSVQLLDETGPSFPAEEIPF